MSARHMLMALALALSCWLAIFADSGKPDTEIVEALAPSGTRSSVNAIGRGASKGGSTEVLRLKPRQPFERLVQNQLSAKGLFASGSWNPPPKPVPKEEPKAPALPYTFAGKKREAGQWEVYLMAGEELRVAKPNSTLDGKYRIGQITPPTLELVYLPLSQTQTLHIGAAQ